MTFMLKEIISKHYVSLRMQLDQEPFPLEGYLPDLGPAEGVDPGDVLEHGDAHVSHR